MAEPKIRFKADDGSDFPDYQSYLFRDVARLERGSSPRPIQLFFTDKEDGVNWIKIGDVSEGETHITKTEQKITPGGAKKSRKVHAGDIILSNSMSFGRPYILDIDGYIHDGWFVIRDYDKYFNRDYLCQFLGSDNIQMQYKRLSAGGVVSNISSDLVYSVNVCLPSLSEQQKIADFLSDLDDVISASEDEVANLEKQKKAVMQKIFSQEVRFKKEDGSDFPDWEEDIGKNRIDIINGKPFDSSKFTDVNNGNPIIRIRDLVDSNITLYTTEEYEDKYKIQKGNILIGMDGDFDVVKWNNIDVGLNQRIMRVIGKNGYIDEFMYYQLIPLVYEINIRAPFSTVKHLSSKSILELNLLIPHPDEQQLIADFLTSYDEAITAAKQELEKWKELKKGLLQQMFV